MQPRRYGPFPYSPIIRRKKLTWPNGARVALWVIPNIEFFSLEERPGGHGPGKIPDVSMWGSRDYGNRVGVFRLMETMSRHGVRGSVALNSDVCLYHPEIIEEGNKLGWEWFGHNRTNTRRLNEVPPEEEVEIIRDSVSVIGRVSGTRPVGWLGSGLQETWNTLDLLAENGFQYVCDWVNDDQPSIMSLPGGRRLVNLPYSSEINDKPAFEQHHRTADEFGDMICRQFDVLYREGAESGRVMAIALHPYLTGMPHRIGALDAALDYIMAHEGVWAATGREIVAHYLQQTQHHEILEG
jgi:allantoinase